MTVFHVVQFAFNDSAGQDKVKEACDRILDLKNKCIHPSSQQPYIKSSNGGKNNSIENLSKGLTHAYVMEFGSVADRDFYIKEDPAHLDFVTWVTPLVEDACVVDFSPGQY